MKTATKHDHLPDCNPYLYQHGTAVLIITGLNSEAVEAQVQRWARELGVSLDWCFVGGRALVLSFPRDAERVRERLKYFRVDVQVQ